MYWFLDAVQWVIFVVFCSWIPVLTHSLNLQTKTHAICMLWCGRLLLQNYKWKVQQENASYWNCDRNGRALLGQRNCMWLMGSPDSKVHGANMGPTWVLSAPDGSHVGPMNHEPCYQGNSVGKQLGIPLLIVPCFKVCFKCLPCGLSDETYTLPPYKQQQLSICCCPKCTYSQHMGM